MRLILFDALHTLVTPRLPIATQYALVFERYLGKLPADSIKDAFGIGVLSSQALTSSTELFWTALRDVQHFRPAYSGGSTLWWEDVVRRTAIGAGAAPDRVEHSLPSIMPVLLGRFSSSEGYRLFDDVLPTLRLLKGLDIQLAVVSNADARMHDVLKSLCIAPFFDAVVLSSDEGTEKPDPLIFERALTKTGFTGSKTTVVHVGDDYKDDYKAAINAGLSAILLQRPSDESTNTSPRAQTHDSQGLPASHVISSLSSLLPLLDH